MGYGRQRYHVKTNTNSTFGLNITSMTDMFTILLVFLLQSYSTSLVEINPVMGVNLPTSNTDSNPVEGVRVSVSASELKIGDRTIASLKEAQFNGSDVDPNDSNFILPLFRELEKLSKENAAKDVAKGEKKLAEIDEGRILLQADQSLNYSVLRKVMYTASMAGFPKLKLATVVGD
jgi:biopolymer transport protein ExbD